MKNRLLKKKINIYPVRKQKSKLQDATKHAYLFAPIPSRYLFTLPLPLILLLPTPSPAVLYSTIQSCILFAHPPRTGFRTPQHSGGGVSRAEVYG